MREGNPPGVAYRVFERLPSGDLRFIGIAFLMASTPTEVRFRWAGLDVVASISRKTWDDWHTEVKPDFIPRLWPREQ